MALAGIKISRKTFQLNQIEQTILCAADQNLHARVLVNFRCGAGLGLRWLHAAMLRESQ
jgi:hypothetical protein